MHSLQKQFHDFIQAENLLPDKGTALLAVSGGVDSMVMAKLFLVSNFKFSIAHCNFNLRGKDSDEDEIFVEKWAKENKIEFHSKKFDLEKGSTQLAARNARYEWFNELCDECNYSTVVTAHHLNDSFETLLINLTRGTGPKGIVGIQPKTGRLVRPLLFASKEQIIQYATEELLNWREDASNETNVYDRNLIRNEIVPKLKQLNPSLIDTYRNTFNRLLMANDLIQEKVDSVRSSYLTINGDTYELTLSWLKEPSDLLILTEILSEYGFNYVTSMQVFEAIGKSGKTFSSERYQITMDRRSLFIKQEGIDEQKDFVIEKVGDFNSGHLKGVVELVKREELEFGGDSNTAYFDADKLKFPLTIRNWHEGDKFRPLGLDGSKKVSDYLIDKKVPLALKDNVMVLISNGDIVWLIGHQISEDLKISDLTKSCFRVFIRKK